MVVMTQEAFTGSTSGRPFAVRDLEAMPADGHRYELIDGMLMVSPAPGRRHQKIIGKLYGLLEAACPPECDVVVGPFAVQPSYSTELQPDVLVGRFDDFTEKNLPVAPLLAVEVLSPSTALNDLNTKKAAYARMGVTSYWVVNPTPIELTVFKLTSEGAYELVAKISGDETFSTDRPYPVTVVPRALLGRLADQP
ncbi:Uma2 family endonuclease [Fodinicola feengrottensis]|uniref:Uma2 family endonuclease n=1 Tax=Fodinicola feengrottensis TaxID=435914 RepID=A0ABP4S1F5_9ACTN|nr:Uma2 family endonuclease [Fodinicola feengrottensis]